MKRLLAILLLTFPLVLMAQEDSVVVWRPSPARAVWLATLVPGAGQIYNRSYWKLPIVYGGLMGCTYAITWNNSRYGEYKEAYRDLYTDDQNGCVSDDPSKSYIRILPTGYTIDLMGGTNTYIQTLQSRQNTYRRWRDLSIVATVLVYGLSIIDAYVDAQLFDFDISPDLSLQVNPQIINDYQNRKSAELQVAIHF